MKDVLDFLELRNVIKRETKAQHLRKAKFLQLLEAISNLLMKV